MKGDKKVIAYLNNALKHEMTAINQYFLHSRLLEDWGITKLAKHEYKESIEEMQHADEFLKRILLLGGMPNMQELGKLLIGEDVKELLECDLKLEIDAIKLYREAIAYCEKASDFISRDLFAKILAAEEEHADGIQTQLDLIASMGVQNYILMNSDPIGAGEG
ncbi:MAG: bacterioferritin [Alphaproteobacteria bacterium]